MTVFRLPIHSSLLAIVVGLLLSVAPAIAEDKQTVFTQQPEVLESNLASGTDAAAEQPAAPSNKSWQTRGPKPEWIWSAESGQQFVFRKEFTLANPVKQARLIASGDNHIQVRVNGKRVCQSDDWNSPATADVTKHLKAGKNELLLEGRNDGGIAALILKLEMTQADGKLDYLVTDSSWQVAKNQQADDWAAAVALHKLGGGPWGNVFAKPGAPKVTQQAFQVPPGFRVEKLFDVPKATLGSWVSITFDDKGRLIACDQGDKGLCRITLPAIGSGEATKVERLDLKITAAHGMLYAFDSLYLSVNGGPGSGLYRARDTNGDDQFDEVTKLKVFAGGGEHGPHALRLSPDGKSIFVVCGNHTNPPQEFDASRVPKNWSEDLLLPRQWDARGHARGKLAPGGWVAKTDPDGKTWEIFSIGYRNSYDMDFNTDGELFVYDADMEWDMGSPWYRPTRAVHAASGSEFGWRSGTGKWPTYYVDSLPPLVDIGPGSPTGVCYGTGAKFPAKYQKALYLADWTFGTIYAVHLTPSGASYTGEKQEFVSRGALPLTDVEIGPDGAMVFTVGGRGTDSALFRVTYQGKESTAPVDGHDPAGAELRALRRQLEAFHGHAEPGSLELIWPALGHEDRFIRYAARVALESQGLSQWRSRALALRDPQASITALVALSRQGTEDDLSGVLESLGRIDYAKLGHQQRLELLRAYSLAFIRLGQPDQAIANGIAARLDPHFPADNDAENRELCNVLVYLDSPTVIGKCLDLLEQNEETKSDWSAELLVRNSRYGGTIAKILANAPEIQKIHYAFALRNMRYGWTIEQRKRYFAWLNSAKERSGGNSYVGFIDNIRKEAIENMSPAEKLAIESQLPAPPPKLEELPKPEGPGREWQLEEVVKLTANGFEERSFERGKRMFAAAQCVACHRLDGAGGATGPDLTNVAGRFSPKDLADALINPSKIVSDQYRASTIVTEDGRVMTGRIINEVDGKYTILTDPIDATKVIELNRDEIDQITPSKVSLMPAKLLDQLNPEEVLDLMAYLLSRGNPNDRMFAPEAN